MRGVRLLVVLGAGLFACERPGSEAQYPYLGWDFPAERGEPLARWPQPLGERVAAVALSWQGRPYCWGGAGPHCFDCSGLTWAAWRAAGVPIPRQSDAQSELPAVAMDGLVAGDIVWRPGHVGIYVGRGWAVHAPGTGKAVQLQAANKFASAHRPAW